MPSPDISLRVEARGLAELRRELRKLSRELDKEFRVGLAEGAKVVKRAAQTRARRRTGTMSRKISARVTTRDVKVVATVPYASLFEYGGFRPVWGRPRAAYQEAVPFLAPAYRAEQGEVIRLADKAIQALAVKVRLM